MKTKQEIVKEIKALLEELVRINDDQGVSTSKVSTKKGSSSYSGCMGGIVLLIDQAFFETPRSRKEVIDELKREGRHYASHLVSMNLLALTRKRTLTRLQDGSDKNWSYVIRK